MSATGSICCNSKLWAESADGAFQFVSLKEKHLEQAMEVLRKSFFVDEKICIGVEMSKNPAAGAELEKLSFNAALDGLSIVAVEKSSQKVVGVAFNKIQVASPTETPYFETFAASCKEPSSKALVEFMLQVDTKCNLFSVCKADCMLELMFLAVLPDYSGRQVGTNLVKSTVAAAKQLKAGNNCRVPLKNERMPSGPTPKGVNAIFTANATQRIGRKLNFTVIQKFSYDDFEFGGKLYSERIGAETPYCTVEYYMV